MDHDLYSRLTYELKLLNNAKEKYSDRMLRLSDARGILLKTNTDKNGNVYYYAKEKGADDYKYVGTKAANPLIGQVIEVKHIEQALEVIDKNIDLASSMLHEYQSFDDVAVDKLLLKPIEMPRYTSMRIGITSQGANGRRRS